MFRSADVGVGLGNEVVGRSLNISAGGHDRLEHGPPQSTLLGPAASQVVVTAQIVVHQSEGSADIGVLSIGIDIAPVGVDGEEAGGLDSLSAGSLVIADEVDKLLGGVDLGLDVYKRQRLDKMALKATPIPTQKATIRVWMG